MTTIPDLCSTDDLMGRVKDFHIDFNKTPPVYIGGDTVAGRVFLDLKETIRCKKLVILSTGRCHTEYPEMRTVKDKTTGRHHSRLVHYGEEEPYYSHKWLVIDSDSELAAGQNYFDFQFELPANLPCSFEYKHGHVRYEVKAILGQPQKVDKCTKRAFTVLRKLDLNDVENARESVEVQNETKVTTVGCFPAGLINVTMGMDKKGYVPGEVVAPKINLNNASNRNVTVTVELEELIKLHGSRTGHQGPGNVELEGDGHNHIKTIKKDVVSLKSGSIASHTVFQWQPGLIIPGLPPTNLPGCKNIDVQHQIILTVNGMGFASELKLAADITIGTIPLMGDFKRCTSKTLHTWETSQSEQAAFNYTEYALGAIDIKEEGEDNIIGFHTFVPLYPSYAVPEGLTKSQSSADHNAL